MRSDTEAEALEDIRYHLDLVRVWIGTAEFEAFGTIRGPLHEANAS